MSSPAAEVVGWASTVTVPVPSDEVQELPSVTVTPYVPAIPELKLNVFPGSATPPGRVDQE